MASSTIGSFSSGILFTLWIWLVFYELGRFVLNRFRFSPAPEIQTLSFAGLGFLLFSLLTLGLGLLGGFHIPVFRSLYAAGWTGLCLRWAQRSLPYLLRKKPLCLKLPPAAWGWTLIFLLFALQAYLSFGPPIGRDALNYHLTLPQFYLQTGGIALMPQNLYSSFPQSLEMVYTWALALAPDYSPKLLHTLMGLACALTLFAALRKRCPDGIALLATSLFYSTPLLGQIGPWAYVDLALAWAELLALLYVLDWMENANPQRLCIAGAFTGLALGVKYLGMRLLLMLPLLVLAYTFNERKSFKETFKLLGLFLLPALVLGAPWYLKNLAFTGNPIMPFLYSVFGGPDWDAERAALFAQFLRTYGFGTRVPDLLLLPWRLSAYGTEGIAHFDGWIGPGYLLMTPALLGIGRVARPIRFVALYAGLSFALWTGMSQQARLLLPGLAIFALGWGPCFREFRAAWPRAAQWLGIVLALTCVWNIGPTLARAINDGPAPIWKREVSREHWLASRLPSYTAVNHMNRNLPHDARVLFVHLGNIAYYANRSYIEDPLFQEHTLLENIRHSASDSGLAMALSQDGVTHLLINEQAWAEFGAPELSKAEAERFQRFRDNHLKPLAGDGTYYLYELS
ncbi:MAG: glycosyltransferase family 39 protein [Candidatus Omnitrophica bacterium]|nr:glycosyltransferase family 39 protein [Candidatus Omnitrophota bacterium]